MILKKNWITKKIIILGSFIVIFIITSCNKDNEESLNNTSIIRQETIYAVDTEYCAFCDMVYFENKYYIAFRIGDDHAPYHDYSKNGYIKILSSSNAIDWIDELNIEDINWDLRDPCFCINDKKNELLISYGLYSYDNPNPIPKTKCTVLVKDNNKLKLKESYSLNIGPNSDYWLWKIYYHKSKFYGVAYHENNNLILVTSEDGQNYKLISEIPMVADETALLFDESEIIAVSRNAKPQSDSFLCKSIYPYKDWNITQLNTMIESPEMIKIGKTILVGGRSTWGVSIFSLDLNTPRLNPYLSLFANGSYGNRGYPGILYLNGWLYITYYACNNYKLYPSIYLTSIYLNQ